MQSNHQKHITDMHILQWKYWYVSIGNGGVSTPKPP